MERAQKDSQRCEVTSNTAIMQMFRVSFPNQITKLINGLLGEMTLLLGYLHAMRKKVTLETFLVAT